jgi:hypothetical protein
MPVSLDDLSVFQNPQFPVTVQRADGAPVAYGRARLESAGPDQVLTPADAVLEIYDEVGNRLRSIPGEEIDQIEDGKPGKVVTVSNEVEADDGRTVQTRGVT